MNKLLLFEVCKAKTGNQYNFSRKNVKLLVGSNSLKNIAIWKSYSTYFKNLLQRNWYTLLPVTLRQLFSSLWSAIIVNNFGLETGNTECDSLDDFVCMWADNRWVQACVPMHFQIHTFICVRVHLGRKW